MLFSPQLRDKSWGGKDWEQGYQNVQCIAGVELASKFINKSEESLTIGKLHKV